MVLDRVLLIIIFAEVLYTVQVSLRQHVLQPGPFLVVGLIAVTRRILVLTAELPKGKGGKRSSLAQRSYRAGYAHGFNSRVGHVPAVSSPSRSQFRCRGDWITENAFTVNDFPLFRPDAACQEPSRLRKARIIEIGE
jgi:hypothetical protein